MFKKQFMTLAFGAISMSMFGFAQEDYTAYKSDATVQALGSFVKQTTQNGIKQDATNSGGVLGTYLIASGSIATIASRRITLGQRIPKSTTASA